jgi:tetratricopeptide (TPR) repeat protein
MELFDWTVRNIQLVDAVPWPSPAEIGDAALLKDIDKKAWPPAVGARGPGYVQFPWQTLTYGKGDYLDRAHIFVLLCEASDIPATILAVPADEGSRMPYQEWLPAAMIGGQLYLFDSALGLPIPGPRSGSIATLAEVVENPKLLKDLDLTPEESVEKMNYRIDSDDLANITALIVSEPESTSQRMTIVQSSLTGESRMKLVSRADQLAEMFSQDPSIQRVAMWHVPFSVHLFREQLWAAVNKAQYDADLNEKLSWLVKSEIYIDNFVMFRTARNLYLRGVFETDRNSKIRSALSYYFAFMYSDDEISQVENDPLLQVSLGIRKGAEQDFRSWQQQIMFMKSNMALIRADAGFFLALAHYENGNPQPALNWLNRLPELDNDGRWEPWRAYQKGRSWEAAGKYEEARNEYKADNSPQRHGSQVRARWMKELTELKNSST